MPYHLEIEFKNLLTKEEFYSVCKLFHVQSQDFILQKNYYFDYENLLESKQMALRIRIKEDIATMTLKQKAVQPAHTQIEIDEILTDFHEDILKNPFPYIPEKITNHLNMEQIRLDKLTSIGQINTLRKEIDYEGGTLCIDYNLFDNAQEDFELEFEYPNVNDGEIIFENFLVQHNITKRATKNKIARLIDFQEIALY